MKNKWKGVLPGIFLLLMGAAIFFYPSISEHFAREKQLRVIVNHTQQLSLLSSEDLERERLRAEAYNQNLTGELLDPFGTEHKPVSEYYNEILNLNGDGIMAILEIPRIRVELPVYHGTEENTLLNGLGHMPESGFPIGMKGIHPVITGHSGLREKELFTRLDELEIGDLFYIRVLGEVLAYRVDRIRTVLPEELEEIYPKEGEDLVTLVTCTPYGVNSHRLLVRGNRTDYVPSHTADPKISSGQESDFGGLRANSAVIGAAALGLFLGGLLLGSLVKKRQMRKKQKEGANASSTQEKNTNSRR